LIEYHALVTERRERLHADAVNISAAAFHNGIQITTYRFAVGVAEAAYI